MTIQALAQTIVTVLLARLDAASFMVLPETVIHDAVRAVAQILRDESASIVEPEEGV